MGESFLSCDLLEEFCFQAVFYNTDKIDFELIDFREGWLRPLRGMNAVAAGSMPAHALYFTVYEKTKVFLRRRLLFSENDLSRHF